MERIKYEKKIEDISKKNQRLFDNVQGQIEYCYNCQPYERGKMLWILGDRMVLKDLLCDLNVPEKLHDVFVRNLTCNCCGTSEFEPYCDIGVKSQYEIDLDKHIKSAIRKYGKSLHEFKALIKDHPFFALECKIARDIKKEIDAGEIPTKHVSGTFYRCRIVENDIAFESKDLMFAPIGTPKEGRFNHSGQSHLYLSKEKKTAKNEIYALEKPKEKRVVWMQKVNIKKPIRNLLDLTFDWSKMTLSTNALLIALHDGGYISCTKGNKGNWKPDYLITRFIMDCAKKAGYNGIVYESTRGYKGNNIVIFRDFSKNLIPESCPVIETFNPIEYERWPHEIISI